MNFILNLQGVEHSTNETSGAEPASLSFWSPVTCYSTTSVAVC